MSELHPNPRVVATELKDGTGVLLHLETKFYFTLNATGIFVWNELQRGPRSLDGLVGAMVAAFEVEEPVARRDISALLDELESERLVLRG